LARSSAWEGLTYRPLEAPGREARELYGFVGAWAPPEAAVDCGWGAFSGPRLVGALLMETSGPSGMLHGPVVIPPEGEDTGGPPASPAEPAGEPLEIAARLLTEALAHVGTRGIDTLFTRPQGLDPVWVRLGFIPVPEVELPRGFRERPGVGLFAWRGGTALWSAGSRAVPSRSSSSSRARR